MFSAKVRPFLDGMLGSGTGRKFDCGCIQSSNLQTAAVWNLWIRVVVCGVIEKTLICYFPWKSLFALGHGVLLFKLYQGRGI